MTVLRGTVLPKISSLPQFALHSRENIYWKFKLSLLCWIQKIMKYIYIYIFGDGNASP